jgi:TatD DNase family protein
LIDVHCHFEQKDYDADRDNVIEKCKQQLRAVITCCAHPKDFDLTMQLIEKYRGFIFATVGIHPEYIKEISEQEKDEFLDLIKANKEKFVAIGECGLDFAWIKEPEWREKQKQQFIQFIHFANDLKKPLVVHSRNAYEEVVKILEQEDAKQVLLHLFGDNKLVGKLVDNKWYVSIGPIVLRSKKHFQITRDMPIEFLLTETDAPWNAPEIFLEGKKVRNDSTSIKIVIERISEIKKLSFNDIDKITTENAIKFFNLV